MITVLAWLPPQSETVSAASVVLRHRRRDPREVAPEQVRGLLVVSDSSIAKADGPNTTAEASETNNTRTRSIKVNP